MYGGKDDYNLLECIKESKNEAQLKGKHIILFWSVWRWMNDFYNTFWFIANPNKITLQLYVHKHVDTFTPEL